jgi:hypothetical protein
MMSVSRTPLSFQDPSLYIPEKGVHLLSPQHWGQVARDTYPNPRETRCITYDDSIVLEWCQRTSKKTVPINSKLSNVGTIKLAPGFECYNAYEAMLPQDQYFIYDASVADDEGRLNKSIPSVDQREPYDDQREDVYKRPDDVLQQTPTMQEAFSLDGPKDAELPEVIPDEEDRYLAVNLSAEFLHYHHQFGYCSPKK